MSARLGAGPEQKHSEEAASLREDETAWATGPRTLSEEEPLTPVGNGEGSGALENPMTPVVGQISILRKT